MKINIRYALAYLPLVFVFVPEVAAQKYPERNIVRQGNRDYAKGAYAESEIDYRRALEKNPYTYEAYFNLGNSLYKQERFEEAGKIYSELASGAGRQELDPASIHYNIGNSLFEQGKLEEALEEYKKSLRINPDDTDAKFNLAYIKKLLEQENEDQDDQDDQDQENGQDDSKDDTSGDNNEESDSGDDEQDDRNQDHNENSESDQPSGITRQQAEQMLDAVQNSEDRTREKVDEKKAVSVVPSGKNW